MASFGRIRRAGGWAAAAALCVGTVLTGPAAYAVDGSIEDIESEAGTVQVLFSVPDQAGGQVDLDGVELSLDGAPLDARARLASDTDVTRTTILAIDVSNSMRGAKFQAARKAARTFVDTAPDDVEVGIVTFAGDVTVRQEPSLDREASRAVIQGLDLSFGTSLYDGVARAVRASGTEGPRRVLVLSDGRDSTDTALSTATTAIKRSDVRVDVVALDQAAADERRLLPLSKAGDGSVISAADSAELADAFTRQAQELAGQVLVTAPVPDGTGEGTLSLALTVGGETFSDSAYATLSAAAPGASGGKDSSAVSTALSPPAPPAFEVPREALLGIVLMFAAGVLVLVFATFGGLSKEPESIQDRIEAYTTKGGSAARKPVAQAPTMTAQAVNVAQRALSGNRGFEAKLAAKLDAAGLSLKPAEWLLLHAGISLGATAMAFLLTGGDPLLSVLALGGGIVVPWVFLGVKQSRRLKAFNGQLAGTLQLLAGSLQAGLSIGQGMDTIVREAAEPVAGEFRRALVETRLGVQIEDSLDSIAERMMSDDFRWTVMAIRIQREVGGNLAELLLTVAATLRERDYLRRQVKSLSAEGRFSAYILLALPPGVLMFMYMTNRAYLAPLIETAMGWVLLAGMGVLMSVGAFMMSRMVKLEV